MAYSVVTNYAKEVMVRARAGMTELPTVTHMAFGNGGVKEDGTTKIPTSGESALYNELLRKPITDTVFVPPATVTYSCTLLDAELAGERINEIALFDTVGNMVAKKCMTDKIKDSDMKFTHKINDEF